MSLSINVGILANLLKSDSEGAIHYKKCFAKVNEVLAEEKLPLHHEPEVLPVIESRDGLCGFPYSYVHHLRRFYAYVVNDPEWKPVQFDDDTPSQDPVLEDQYGMLASHLLCHSDCEGFYLPIDFKDVVFDNKKRVPGAMIGSSFRLREELILIAPYLDIKLQGKMLSDEEAEKLNQAAEEQDGPFWIEKTVWLSLFEAERLSIKHKAAICFS